MAYQRYAEGGRISIISVAIMTGIGVFELIVALITGSFSLLGDTVDSFSDSAIKLEPFEEHSKVDTVTSADG